MAEYKELEFTPIEDITAMEEKCEFCKYYKDGNLTHCRHNPPKAIAIDSLSNEYPYLVTVWPNVDPSDWCGRFQRK